MSVICIDTNIAIWGIKRQSSSTQVDMIRRAEIFLSQLKKDDKRILIPSIVLGEMLIDGNSAFLSDIQSRVERSFIVGDYGALAAMHFARLWRNYNGSLDVKELRESGKTRHELKADRMIVATAIAFGAECIYSHDPGVKLFGGKEIEVRELPVLPDQLFLNLSEFSK